MKLDKKFRTLVPDEHEVLWERVQRDGYQATFQFWSKAAKRAACRMDDMAFKTAEAHVQALHMMISATHLPQGDKVIPRY